jgi:hypothetical protein
MRKDRYPYFTTARFPSVCAETGRPIKPGDQIVYWSATRQVYHIESEAAAELRSQQFAQAWNMEDANW